MMKLIFMECQIIRRPENATIIRTSIIGHEINHKKSLLEWIISNKNKEINGYRNHLWNGVTCLTLAKIIKNMIDDNIFGKVYVHIYLFAKYSFKV